MNFNNISAKSALQTVFFFNKNVLYKSSEAEILYYVKNVPETENFFQNTFLHFEDL